MVDFSGKKQQEDFSIFALGVDGGGVSDESPNYQEVNSHQAAYSFIEENEFSAIALNENGSISLSEPVELTVDFTVGYWVNPSRSSGWAVLNNGETYYRLIGHNNLSQISLFVPNIRIDLSTSLRVGEWQHVALTRKDDLVTVFVDGYPAGSSTWSGWVQVDQIGGSAGNLHWSPFTGSVTDVIVFDYALESEDIVDLKNGIYTPGVHAPFRLDPINGSNELFLSRDGQIIDSVTLGEMGDGQSQGWSNPKSESSSWLFMQPSPGEPNPEAGEILAIDLKIAEWKYDKASAVSVHFDDNVDLHFSVAQPIMDQFEIPGTFHLVVNWLNSEIITLAQAAVAVGHEIGSHSMTHPKLAEVSMEELRWEVRRSKELIEEYFMGVGNCIVMAYPSGSHNQIVIDELIEAGYLMGRRVGQANPSMKIHSGMVESDFFALGPGYTVVSTTTSEDFLESLDLAIAENGWFNPMFHGINNRGWEPISDSVFQEMMAGIADRRNDLWIATIGDIVRYSRQRLASSVRTVSYAANIFTVVFSSESVDPRLDVPLTVVGNLPEGRTLISIWDESGEAIPFIADSSSFRFDRKMTDGVVYVETTPPASRYSRWITKQLDIDENNSQDVMARSRPDFHPDRIRYFTGIDALSDSREPVSIQEAGSHEYRIRWHQHIRTNDLKPSVEYSWNLKDWFVLPQGDAQFLEEVDGVNIWQSIVEKDDEQSPLFVRMNVSLD